MGHLWLPEVGVARCPGGTAMIECMGRVPVRKRGDRWNVQKLLISLTGSAKLAEILPF